MLDQSCVKLLLMQTEFFLPLDFPFSFVFLSFTHLLFFSLALYILTSCVADVTQM